MADDKPMDRRRFFRRGLSELLKPISSAISPLERMAREVGNLEATAAARSTPRPKPAALLANQPADQPPAKPGPRPLGLWLRPPGALPEAPFKATCTRGGECVRACPVQCIKIDATGAKGNGFPYIDADTAACTVCDGLYCMDVCPSGALVPTAAADIDMGTAVWREERCLRDSGQDCTVCVDRCPMGDVAITLKDGRINVHPLGCIGCGECQHHCPTNPKAIAVIPKAAKEAPL